MNASVEMWLGMITLIWLGLNALIPIAIFLRAERKRTMNGALKNQWQVWMRAVNMAAKERTPRGLLYRLASREIAEQLNTNGRRTTDRRREVK